jgi:hypothetical protein
MVPDPDPVPAFAAARLFLLARFFLFLPAFFPTGGLPPFMLDVDCIVCCLMWVVVCCLMWVVVCCCC